MFNFLFFFNSILLGVGLAMDAFSVSLANGLNEPNMPNKRMFLASGTFAVFQGIMPLIGWVCVHTVVEKFRTIEKFVPLVALALLGFIGGKMLYEGIKETKCGCDEECQRAKAFDFKLLAVQGVATSIDALSVGFTISDYNFLQAFVAVVLIAIVTFFICFGGIYIGKKFGTALAGKSSILGGAILILIGIEIFITSLI